MSIFLERVVVIFLEQVVVVAVLLLLLLWLLLPLLLPLPFGRRARELSVGQVPRSCCCCCCCYCRCAWLRDRVDFSWAERPMIVKAAKGLARWRNALSMIWAAEGANRPPSDVDCSEC